MVLHLQKSEGGAYGSLKRNPPYLGDFAKNKELMMPNVINILESKFSENKG